MARITTKIAVGRDLVAACRAEIEKVIPADTHPLARAGRLSDSAVCEIAMGQAIKLNSGVYEEALAVSMYQRVNRTIAEQVAQGIARVVEGAEVRYDSEGWPEVVARIAGEPTYAISMQREYLKPAGRVMN